MDSSAMNLLGKSFANDLDIKISWLELTAISLCWMFAYMIVDGVSRLVKNIEVNHI